MIIDKLENLPMYFSLHPDMEKACEFLKDFYANPGELRRYDSQHRWSYQWYGRIHLLHWSQSK